ncbi:NAD-dependent epimerase/dehydratase family protein [Catenuloplanes atrovinosus]|uniref:Nucleoside-diphosphate-sugar epimerase n=1 Tax=Catenuloplanes atrovinosus TaxID=137266 RepID=A0AAE3YQW3_9ACTN|nr:NAD(P)-dependent oxidoreductase [Catenuloplanes atrovinosus]MDR7276991.1 nucleoside-diphosphate-sugar epimerase [Catenuloplanes atrovinosus]
MDRELGTGRRVVVLGGTGSIGRHVCARLRRDGWTVLAVARHATAVPDAGRFLRMDVAAADVPRLTALLCDERIGAVVNATDGANTSDGWDHPAEHLIETNVRAVRRLVDAIAAVPWRPRLVHLGTIHEYGPVPPGVSVHEDAAPRPAGDYARSKLGGSTAVLDAARSGRIDGVVLRLTNVTGPHPSPAGLPGKLLARARAAAGGERVGMGVADARRDFVDVRDVAAAVSRALASTATGQAFNIGSGAAVPIADVIRALTEAAGLPEGALYDDGSAVRSVGGDWIQADVRRAADVLGWTPEHGLAESLRAMWRER